MKTFAYLLPAFALLAACGEAPPQEDPAEVAAEQAAAEGETAPAGPPAPDAEVFAAVFAKACPQAEPVSSSNCLAEGMARETFACEYGLGDDEAMRYDAKLEADGTEWAVADTETVCAQGSN